MAWTWEEIDADWLAGGRVAVSPEVITDAFNRVEDLLGRDWLEQPRINSGVIERGSFPTLRIVSMGQRLGSLKSVRHPEKLLERIRTGGTNAEAELTALYLVAAAQTSITLELEPDVTVGGRKRQPDFRVHRPGTPWTYVEVTQPSDSEQQEEVKATLATLSGLLARVKTSFALEVFLRRNPSAAESEYLARYIPTFCQEDGMHLEELPDQLGKLFLNHDEPGRPVVRTHQGEEGLSGSFAIAATRGPDEPHRHVMVRIAFTDDRAAKFLKKKASQLPKERPGLIMIETSNATGAFGSWEPLLTRRFQPHRHTRVSAVCLWRSGQEQAPGGAIWKARTNLLLNPHANFRLPRWITESLARFQ